MTETQSSDPTTYDVPDDAESERCPECGRPFVREELLALHRGGVHAETLGADEIETFEEAYEDESERLRLFRLKALIALVVLYFGLLMTYALV
ncbi:DNA binding domain containing protein [Halorhabdus tiamatea SARL4B]|uniref:DNA binding domain containing protein n=1 Tax=Halorhabdus tiamatea SARL4B TaxID=1033806 RepID=F7PN03_9EURY|nr:hypothetical protein [Halorhabdus tiamatea]ERJ07709.1 DNA binding domain containing protein [Halorhabdus tiamatea SARL4B]CCQ32633.1 DNA binding protein [Halorhabdus tiamatea SARL4B]